MAEPGTTTETVGAAPHKEGTGFPPFKTETFPSQVFWLAITFAFLFVVLWRFAGPAISGVITARRGRINDDLASAQAHKANSEAASAAYQTALSGARGRAQALAESNRKTILGEIDRAKAQADARANADVAAAEARIAASRSAARTHVVKAAEDAAIQIVARLTGDSIGADEAAAAVRSVTGS